MSKTENNILLFSITLCWASSYIFIKELPSSLSDYGYLTMTCGIAAILLTVVFWKYFKQIRLETRLNFYKRGDIKRFFIVRGAFLALGIPFKVMVLIEGFTEVRPVNAIPPVCRHPDSTAFSEPLRFVKWSRSVIRR